MFKIAGMSCSSLIITLSGFSTTSTSHVKLKLSSFTQGLPSHFLFLDSTRWQVNSKPIMRVRRLYSTSCHSSFLKGSNFPITHSTVTISHLFNPHFSHGPLSVADNHYNVQPCVVSSFSMPWTKTWWKKLKTATDTVPFKMILKSYWRDDMSVYLWGSKGNHITLFNNLRPGGLNMGGRPD